MIDFQRSGFFARHARIRSACQALPLRFAYSRHFFCLKARPFCVFRHAARSFLIRSAFLFL